MGVTGLRAVASLISGDIGGPASRLEQHLNSNNTTNRLSIFSLSVNNFRSLNMVKARLSNKIHTCIELPNMQNTFNKRKRARAITDLRTADGDNKNSHR